MSKHIHWQKHLINQAQREKLMGHKSLVIWLTGLSGSGKSTIGNHVEQQLYQEGIHSFLLDGDDMRQGINKDLGFKREDRTENTRRIAEIATVLNQAGIIAIVSTISPFKEDREMAKNIISKDYYSEVYIKCSLEECERRDPKGLYQKAKSGEIKQFTGVSQPYQEPEDPDLILDTTYLSVQKSSHHLTNYIKSQIEGEIR
ncbi:adenylyl-sulfate kinase [Alkalibacillus silvisoli]|uniref:Adenylyl-sulfate kinase n=1 Tax=Alkalibacillus silvisoli TaxID=392823 RepID=A0ABN0ZNR9_9BACI